jgi:hypothetical protein
MTATSRTVEATCAGCGGCFQATARTVARGGGRFCRTCRARHAALSTPKRFGADHPGWKGGRTVHDGYVTVAENGTVRREHVIVAERALGKSLPPRAVVHHANHVRADNSPRNLVICEDQAYHMLLHALERVRRAGGRPFIEALCRSCREIKLVTEFGPVNSHGRRARSTRCRECSAGAQREFKQKRKAARRHAYN